MKNCYKKSCRFLAFILIILLLTALTSCKQENKYDFLELQELILDKQIPEVFEAINIRTQYNTEMKADYTFEIARSSILNILFTQMLDQYTDDELISNFDFSHDQIRVYLEHIIGNTDSHSTVATMYMHCLNYLTRDETRTELLDILKNNNPELYYMVQNYSIPQTTELHIHSLHINKI